MKPKDDGTGTMIIDFEIQAGEWRYLRVSARNVTDPRGEFSAWIPETPAAVLGGGQQLGNQIPVVMDIKFIRVETATHIRIKQLFALITDDISINVNGAYWRL